MGRKAVGGERGPGVSSRWHSVRERGVGTGSAPTGAPDTHPGRPDRTGVRDPSAGTRPVRCSFEADARRIRAQGQDGWDGQAPERQ